MHGLAGEGGAYGDRGSGVGEGYTGMRRSSGGLGPAVQEKARPLGTRRRARLTGALALVLAFSGLSAVSVSTVTAAPAAAAAEGCDYADSSPNNGRFASTICWFDFTGFDQATARQAAGQPMQVTLDGGYVANFTVKLADVTGAASMGVERRTTPLETRFAFGTDAYRGIPGLHTLYSLPSPAGLKAAKLSFEDIEIVDTAGNTVSGYSFVAADTEDNVSGESFVWSSDTPLTEIERLAPNGGWGCKNPVGLGTTEVSCAGTGSGGTTTAGGKSTALLVAADSPTFFATQWSTPSRSAIAIGIQTAKLSFEKLVAGRINAADSFDLAVTNQAGALAGQATTGMDAGASTGAINVVAGGTYTLEERTTPGSPALLSNYDASWTCVNGTPESPTLLPSGAGTSKSVTPAVGDDITCTVTNTAKSVDISLEKHAAAPVDVNGNGITDAGDTIAYTFTVTNTGEVGLDGIAVDDPKVGSVTCPASVVAPTASVTCTADAPYVVNALDVSAGAVNNSATATGFAPGADAPVTSAPSTTSTPATAPAPGLSIVKSASPSNAAAYTAGRVITYSFVVTNTGNVPVSNVSVVESGFSGTGVLGPIACPPGSDTLAAGAQAICTATYTLTQGDVDNGSVTNSATATGTPVGGGDPIATPPSEARIPVEPSPAISLTKAATPATASLPGSEITYTFAVTNTGNVSLSDATVSESAFSGTGPTPTPTCPTGTFVPGATVTCTAVYRLTQSDVDTGTVTNTATAAATAANGDDPESDPSSAIVTIPAAPALTLVKSAAPSAPADFTAGQVVTYSFVVTNTGNVTLTDVRVQEGEFGGTGTLSTPSCADGAASLAPGAQVVCSAEYTLTQADIDAGSLTNAATATGTPPGPTQPPVSPPSEITIPSPATPALALVKTADTASITRAGQVVTYSFTVTNTGNTTLTDPRIVEGAFTGAGTLPEPVCPADATHLLPGQRVVCTTEYTVLNADLTGRPLVNTATASATEPGGDPVTSDSSTARVDDVAVPAQPASPLADTGYAIASGLGLTALGLLAAGAILLVIRRRRRTA